jgi:hypothetical protein
MATKQPPVGRILPKRWEEDESTTHDRHGRLKPGRRGPVPTSSAARRWKAIDEATWEAEGQYVPDVLEALRKKALEGDERAARIWLERVAGKAREQPERARVTLPAPTDIDGIRAAVLAAMGADAASLAATAVERALTAVEAQQATAYLRAITPQAAAEESKLAGMTDEQLLEAVRLEVARREEP